MFFAALYMHTKTYWEVNSEKLFLNCTNALLEVCGSHKLHSLVEPNITKTSGLHHQGRSFCMLCVVKLSFVLVLRGWRGRRIRESHY